ncbi:spore coat protein CotJB [Sulfoacidibacillus thermotolerans]|uniref:Spore coat protein CotJB n=1 Tax=Sulfoacidibacillus thermotolerans TaxID=1765684 RepID=A0A2U3DA41_SULT2|nr:spore coat protein CotJB [Sulfoacidibacillus thermotolerans]PWI58157.1 spore coat protein CotJB [Sulfoacidibacillus thermotolerans]
MTNPLPPQFYNQLQELQSLDFVLSELTLYLDTHPTDTQAIAQFEQFLQRKESIERQFEQIFGPLTSYSQQMTQTAWQWIESPWPWQM